MGLSEGAVSTEDCWERMNNYREYVDEKIKTAEDECWGGIDKLSDKFDKLYWWILASTVAIIFLLAGILLELAMK